MKSALILNQTSELKAQFVGNKAANLGFLYNRDFRVPPFFCLTISAFARYLAENNINLAQKENSKREQIQDMIRSGHFPKDLVDKIDDELGKFENAHQPESLSIRSTAIGEDSPNYSFAGQFKSLLKVKPSLNAILESIKEVWASQLDPVNYFGYKQESLKKPLMGVIIQKMINADYSGVIFTQNPVSSKEDEILIEVTKGIGDQLVGGDVVPDQYMINRTDLSFTPALENRSGDLSRRVLEQIVMTALKIEEKFASPQDIEWALAGETLYILQSRAITTKAPAENEDTVEWTDENVGEVIPDIVTPLTWSMLGPITNESFRYFLRRVGIYQFKYKTLFDTYLGKVYFNRTGFQDILARFYLKSLIRSLKEDKTNIIRLMSSLLQFVWTGVNAFLLIVYTPWINKRFIKKHRRQTIKWQKAISKDTNKQGDGLDEILKLHQRTMNFHVTVTFLGEIFYQGLKKLFEDWHLNTEDISADVVLQSLNTIESSESGRSLLAMSEKFFQNDQVIELLRKPDLSKVSEELQSQHPACYKMFEEFMEAYGHGALHEFELLYPRWYEDPEYLFQTMRSYLHNRAGNLLPDDAVSSRETVIEYCKAKLPLMRRLIFMLLLRRTQIFIAQRESLKQAFLRAHLILKLQLMNMGQTLVDNKVISDVLHIFYLKLEELHGVLNHDLPVIEIHKKVSERLSEREQYIKSFHPKAFHQTGDKVVWNHVEPSIDKGSSFFGIGCSHGRVTGRACVLTDPGRGVDLKKGDILVAPSTNPGWTPLFVIASGAVTEIGGALSHGAIIAREYAIPMVTAIPEITKIIKTGDIISVDGNTGRVDILN